MRVRTIVRTMAGGALLLLVGFMPVEAQVGRLKKAVGDRARDAVRTEADPSPAAAPATATAPAAASRYGPDVLELTAPVLERLARALAAEEKARQEVAAVLRARGHRDRLREAWMAMDSEWQMCAMEVFGRPDFEQRSEQLSARQTKLITDAMDSGSLNTVAGAPAFRKAQSELDQEWTAHDHAVLEAAAKQCGPVRGMEPLPTTPDSGMEAGELSRLPLQQALEAGEFTDRQYAMLKERIPVFCATGARASGYVFSPEETQALQPRCGELMPRLQSVL
jgi:hypothetical protein